MHFALVQQKTAEESMIGGQKWKSSWFGVLWSDKVLLAVTKNLEYVT